MDDAALLLLIANGVCQHWSLVLFVAAGIGYKNLLPGFSTDVCCLRLIPELGINVYCSHHTLVTNMDYQHWLSLSVFVAGVSCLCWVLVLVTKVGCR